MKKIFLIIYIAGLSFWPLQAQISVDMSLGKQSSTYIIETSHENWVLRQKAVQNNLQGSMSESLTFKTNIKNATVSFSNPILTGNDIMDLKIDLQWNNSDISLYWLYLENGKDYPLLEEDTDDYVQGNNIDFSAEFKSESSLLSSSSAFDFMYRELGELKISTYTEASLTLRQFALSANVERQNFDKWAKIVSFTLSSTNMDVLYSFSEGHSPVFGGTARIYEAFLQSCFTQGIVEMQTKSKLEYSSDGGKTATTDYSLGIGPLNFSITSDRTSGALKQIKSPKLQLEFENAGFSIYANKIYANITLKTESMSININQDRTVKIFLTFET